MKSNKAAKQQKAATARFWAIAASAMPIIVTFAFLFWKGIKLNWVYGAAGMLATMLVAFLIGEGMTRLIKVNRKLSTLCYLLTFAAIGVAPALASVYAATGSLLWNTLWIAAPMGLVSVGILRAKTARDIHTPSKCTSFMYGLEVILPLAVVGICSIIGIMPMHTIILFMTIPVAVALHRTMKRGVREGAGPLVDLDTRTVNFLLVVSALLTVAFVAARFIF